MCTSGASYSVKNGRSGIMYAGTGNWKNRKSDIWASQSVGTADIED
jgi:hypothetical protein